MAGFQQGGGSAFYKNGMVFIAINLTRKLFSMKKIVFLPILIATTFFACNNKKSNSKAGKDADTYKQVPVPNVNGNIPDTTNSIDLSTNKTDSSGRDSSSKNH
jgi:hypothetical protein